jgi:short-subunit dehydrogenase
MGVSRSSAPGWMWLDPDVVVREALRDFDAGKSLSVPSLRYKVLTALARYVPPGVLARFQQVGRR